jgi:hypothetical protein
VIADWPAGRTGDNKVALVTECGERAARHLE